MPTPESPSASVIPVAVMNPDGGNDVELGSTLTGAAAAIAPSLTAVTGKTTYMTHFLVDGLGATAAAVIAVVITGLIGGTITRYVSVPAGATVPIAVPLMGEYSRGVPASAPNTPITMSVPSFGAGNTSAIASIRGFQR